MVKFQAGMITKLMSPRAAATAEESEQEDSDEEFVENAIFDRNSGDELEDEDHSEGGEDELDDAKTDEDEEDEEDEEEEEEKGKKKEKDDDDDDEMGDDNGGRNVNNEESDKNVEQESAKNKKRKAEDSDKSSKKSKQAENNDDDDDVEEDVEDEENEDEEEEETNKSEQKRKKRVSESPEKMARTLFVGNLPYDFNKKAFKAMLNEYGPVQNFRVRSIAPSKESLSKKVAYLSGKINANKVTVNVYAVYKSPESITKALEINGKEFEKHILRADRCTPVKVFQNTKSTVFIGNIPTKATENQLHAFFSTCGQINKVRIIRDRETCAGKGIGYVEFSSKDAAQAALEMNGQAFQNRDIRVQEYHYKQQKKQHKRPFQGTEGSKKGFKRDNSKKGFKGETATKRKFQRKGKIIKAKHELAKKKRIAKILAK